VARELLLMRCSHLVVVHPPCAGDHLAVPSPAAAHTRAARLLQREGWHGARGVVVADDGAAGAVKLSVNINVLCRGEGEAGGW
jgi:hypothetical protein